MAVVSEEGGNKFVVVCYNIIKCAVCGAGDSRMAAAETALFLCYMSTSPPQSNLGRVRRSSTIMQ